MDASTKSKNNMPGPFNFVGQARELFRTVGMVVQAPVKLVGSMSKFAVFALPVGVGLIDGISAISGGTAAGAVSTSVLNAIGLSSLTAVAPAGFIMLGGFIAMSVLQFVMQKSDEKLAKLTGIEAEKPSFAFNVVAATKGVAKTVGLSGKIAGRQISEVGNVAILAATGIAATEILAGMGAFTAATGAATTTILGFVPLVGASLATAAAAVSPLALVVGAAVGLAVVGCIAKGVGGKIVSAFAKMFNGKQAGNNGPAVAPA